jgi:CheY-like chemotaxis protein
MMPRSVERLCVLLAEDDPIGAHHATAAVECLGHVVVHAATGRDALGRLKQGGFDVALLDLGLPELSGVDVARRIRNHERARGTSALLIIALTAGDLDESTREAAGIDAVLEKPLQLALLAEVLRSRSSPSHRSEMP